MELKSLGIFLKIDVLREMKRQLRIVLCKESPYNSINVLGPSSVILQQRKFYKVDTLPILLAPVRRRANHKNTSMFWLLTRS